MPYSARTWSATVFRGAFLALASLLLALSPVGVRLAQAKDSSGKPVVVTLGDSYSSGEGTEPFYGQSSANKHDNEDWLAHRSELAWPGKLQIGGMTLADSKDRNWFFMASSGALIPNVTTTSQTINWTEKSSSGSHQLPVQIKVISNKGIKDAVDYVTITVGGNDLGFREIMTVAATQDIPFISSGSLDAKIEEALASLDSTILPNLSSTYQAILDSTGNQATLIVVGYPHLLYDGVSNIFFNASKANLINGTIDTFDAKVADLVASMNTTRIVFVDPRAAFSGHEAYAQDSYINSVVMGSQSEDLDQTLGSLSPSQYSLHPNASGQTAYASAVQATIDKLEGSTPSTIAVKGISITPTTATLTTAGATIQLSAEITPPNASNKRYAWSSSNETVATVSNTGLVTAVGKGSATITATTEDGQKTASCAVTVQIPAKTYTVTFVDWDGSTLSSGEYAEGETPSYSGATPTREATAEFTYTFSGWSPAIEPVTKDATYAAQYNANPIDPVDPAAGVYVYRMYNTKSSEHLFTTSSTEYEACGKGAYADWCAEGVGWLAPSEDYEDVVPVYRLFNRGLNDHHYTTSDAERLTLTTQYGWLDEGVVFFSGDDTPAYRPIYRLYNGGLKSGQHHYTTSLDERDKLIASHGWESEGVGFYALAAQ